MRAGPSESAVSLLRLAGCSDSSSTPLRCSTERWSPESNCWVSDACAGERPCGQKAQSLSSSGGQRRLLVVGARGTGVGEGIISFPPAGLVEQAGFEAVDPCVVVGG